MVGIISGLDIASLGLLALMLVMILFTVKRRSEVKSWGKRLFLLWIIGLALCMVVALRDNYHLSVMAMTDSTVESGVFAADSWQSNLCMILGAVNMFTVLSALFIKKSNYRKLMYFTLVFVITVKVLVIELSIIL